MPITPRTAVWQALHTFLSNERARCFDGLSPGAIELRLRKALPEWGGLFE